MSKIPGNILSHNSGNILHTASCFLYWTDGYETTKRVLISEHETFFIASRIFKFWCFMSLSASFRASEILLSDFEK